MTIPTITPAEVQARIARGDRIDLIDVRTTTEWNSGHAAGARHVPPDMLRVPEQMAALMHWYGHEAAALHPVERAARLHVDFVKIHPFVDGNGRTAGLLLNLELL